MPMLIGGGASNITGAQVVDASLSTADLSAASIETLNPTCKTLIPLPNHYAWRADIGQDINIGGQTTLRCTQYVISRGITVNKISFKVVSNTATGKAKIACYTEDGQTKVFEVETATISGTAVVTTTLGAPAVLNAGIYYICNTGDATLNVSVIGWCDGDLLANVFNGLTGKPTISGSLAITAYTIPATITPGNITAQNNYGPILRLDN
jgi:hypothetical protein